MLRVVPYDLLSNGLNRVNSLLEASPQVHPELLAEEQLVETLPARVLDLTVKHLVDCQAESVVDQVVDEGGHGVVENPEVRIGVDLD